ncbi:fimbrial protein [Erwinia sp. JUb26]|uniref:fimbrial protein n=1 Tax=Erwinia sp. JUb26 TaxID=2485126 RepID=UPI000F91C14E|nr:fimbrial protein [Erwinia sp. JUb26]ROR06347.1 type 1 fimbria pilin [Erwinia sp. JUb26]
MNKLRIHLLTILIIFPIAFPAVSGTPSTVTVKVNVMAPTPCKINNGDPLNSVDFKEIRPDRIDGSNYKQPINYTITCSSWSSSRQISLTLVGDGASFDNKYLKTDHPSLGIKFLADDKPFDLNKPLVPSYPKQPVLQAVPVKSGNITTGGGKFNASATLKIDLH